MFIYCKLFPLIQYFLVISPSTNHGLRSKKDLKKGIANNITKNL